MIHDPLFISMLNLLIFALLFLIYHSFHMGNIYLLHSLLNKAIYDATKFDSSFIFKTLLVYFLLLKKQITL